MTATTHDRFYRVLIFSLGAHAALLAVWPGAQLPDDVRQADGMPGAPLQLSLQSPQQAAGAEQPPSAQTLDAMAAPLPQAGAAEAEPADRDDREPLPTRESPTELAGIEQTSDSAAVKPGRVRTESTMENTGSSRNDGVRSSAAVASPAAPPLTAGQVRDRLHEAVETHFYYPSLARRQGWEGEVVVGIRVEGNGRLSSVDVVSSSGYRVLDNAAVDSIRRLARLRIDGAGRLPESGVEVRMPVQYRLIDAPV